MVGVVFSGENTQEEGRVPKAPQPLLDMSQGKVIACELEQHPGIILNLVIPPDGGVTGEDDNVIVTWIGSPNQVDKDTPDYPH